MSCAEPSRLPSGGRRSAHQRPARVADRIGQVRAPARDPLEASAAARPPARCSANQPRLRPASIPSGAALIERAQHMGRAIGAGARTRALESPALVAGRARIRPGDGHAPVAALSAVGAGPRYSQEPEPPAPAALVAATGVARRAAQDDPGRGRPRCRAARRDVDGPRAAARPDEGDRLRASAEVQMTRTAPSTARAAPGPPYKYSPHARGRLVLADGEPGDGRRQRGRARRRRRPTLPQRDRRPRAPLHARPARRDRHRRRRRRCPAIPTPATSTSSSRRSPALAGPGDVDGRRRPAAQRRDPPGQGPDQRRCARADGADQQADVPLDDRPRPQGAAAQPLEAGRLLAEARGPARSRAARGRGRR